MLFTDSLSRRDLLKCAHFSILPIFWTQRASSQNENCEYFELSDGNIDNLIEYIKAELSYGDKEQTISILKSIRSGSKNTNYLYIAYDSSRGEAFYDNGDVVTSVPNTFIININEIYEQVSGDSEYFVRKSSVDCDQIPFNRASSTTTQADSTVTESPTTTQADSTETKSPIATSTSTSTTLSGESQMAQKSTTAMPRPESVGGFVITILAGILSTEALVVVGLSIIAVLIVRTWPEDDE